MEKKKNKKVVKTKIDDKPKVKRKRRKKKKKGFTLIELLAVIVILGLLMAIAIPSVTKYITESRKKTVTTTLNNYIGALVNEVNDLEYTFTGQNTIYAVPIECISLERGGTSPFGEWMQANDNYFAYVLIQYDDQNSKYVYGFTFKDSAGYGLYPTIQSNIKEKGSQIKTGLDLNRPISGDITSLTTLAKWQQSGFEVSSTTDFKVLEATSEGETGDGETTCTLCQKGKNYSQVEEEKEQKKEEAELEEKKLSNLIKKHNTIIGTDPDFTTSSSNSGEIGLYSSILTNSGQPTYYFRGAVTNNYVEFANLTWRIVRINEDGTIRLVLQNGIYDNTEYKFGSNREDGYTYMYYSNSLLVSNIESWYENELIDYDKFIVDGNYCEQAKIYYSLSSIYSGDAEMIHFNDYDFNFKCSQDGNDKGIIKSKVGVLSFDEVLHAGGYVAQNNSSFYLYNGHKTWTMSPAGYSFSEGGGAMVWGITNSYIYLNHIDSKYTIRPVINLNANVTATGTGTSSDPYIIITE